MGKAGHLLPVEKHTILGERENMKVMTMFLLCVSYSIQRSVWTSTYQVPVATISTFLPNFPLRSASTFPPVMPSGITQATQPIFLWTIFKNSKMSAMVKGLREKTEMSKETGTGVLVAR